MKKLISISAVLACGLAAGLLIGKYPVRYEISGEVFTKSLDSNAIVKQAGTVVYFLSNEERQRYEQLLSYWRGQKYAEIQKEFDESVAKYKTLFGEHKGNSGKVQQADVESAVWEELKELEALITVKRSVIENKWYDDNITFDDDEAIERLLDSVYQVTSDSEGRFRAILIQGAEYWVLAQGELSPHSSWYFRYTPDGTELNLSPGNSR